MSDLTIEASGIQKSFKGQPALSDLNLRVSPGSIFGFLGPNGAGKTTTIKILMGLLKADAGSAQIFGLPITATNLIDIRRQIGFVTEDKELYPYMTVEQVIRFTRPFFPHWRDDLEQRYLRMFDLPRNRKIEKLSKGMRAKLMLLLAASRGAKLLVLDEPTSGLDPVAVEEVLRELVSLSAEGETTVFFSSHQLTEVEQIADHIAIIDRGRCVVSGSLDDLKAKYRRFRIIFQEEPHRPIPWLDGAENVQTEGRTISLLAGRNVDALAEQARSQPGAQVEIHPVTLKELFLNNVGRN